MIRITTLTENTASALELLAEWGLCVAVETEETNVLLDTGQGITVPHNAALLGVDLKNFSHIVLSHGHADHTGGLKNVLPRMEKPVQIIAHPDVFANKYSGRQQRNRRYIGLAYQLPALESMGARFTLSRSPVKISENIMTTGEVPEITDFERIEPDRFFVKNGTGWQPDTLPDDQALIINNDAGLIVILGCAHRGIINTLRHAQNITGRKEIQLVIGGCHLINAAEERVYMTINALKELEVQKIGVSHCTGQESSAKMAGELGDRFFFNNAGTIITVDGNKIEVD